jgi:hypothetical protein
MSPGFHQYPHCSSRQPGQSPNGFATRPVLRQLPDQVPDLDASDSREEYVRARAEGSYETLADEGVASQVEGTIADFLFTHGVEYQYESIAE